MGRYNIRIWQRSLRQSTSSGRCSSSTRESRTTAIDVEVSRPTARGGQTLVRVKMRNLITRAVFDKTFKAGEKFGEPDLEMVDAMFQYADSAGYHFMDQETFDTMTLQPETLGDDRLLLVDNLLVQVQKYNGNPIGLQFPAARRADGHVERARRPRRHRERRRDEERHARDRPRDPCPPLHQGGGKGEGPHRNPRVRGARLEPDPKTDRRRLARFTAAGLRRLAAPRHACRAPCGRRSWRRHRRRSGLRRQHPPLPPRRTPLHRPSWHRWPAPNRQK